jgi:hypothetical protein
MDSKARFYEFFIAKGFDQYVPELYGYIGNSGLEKSEYHPF